MSAHPARTARAVSAGLSTAATLGVVAVLAAADAPEGSAAGDVDDGAGLLPPASVVEVQVTDDADRAEALAAVRARLDEAGVRGQPPRVVVVEAGPVDVTTRAS